MSTKRKPSPTRSSRREVEIRLDRRFLFGFVGLLTLLIVLGLGILVGQLLSPPPSPAVAQPQSPLQVATVAIGQSAQPPAGQAAPASPSGAQAAPNAGAVLTEKDATGLVAGDVLHDPCFVINLLEFEKNVVKADFRLTKASPPEGGPRLVVEGLNAACGNAFDFGNIPPDQVARQTLRIKNEGDQELKVTQIYTSCGCTVAEVEGHATDAEGMLDPPLVLAPGESVAFTIALDAARVQGSNEPRIVQIFSNDPRGVDFPGHGKELRFAVLFRVQ